MGYEHPASRVSQCILPRGSEQVESRDSAARTRLRIRPFLEQPSQQRVIPNIHAEHVVVQGESNRVEYGNPVLRSMPYIAACLYQFHDCIESRFGKVAFGLQCGQKGIAAGRVRCPDRGPGLEQQIAVVRYHEVWASTFANQ
ncbi:hypothetical protein PG996_003459 [Apiospora saccharicola]|uniref:Uncharacterized protein n=1 Tax=Apiospora saccharicola TaxID=335842 RepID=A0ABR1W1B7_9PEZI